MDYQSTNNNVWFITGCTSGVGFALASVLLERGYKVAGTTRDINKLIKCKELVSNPNFLALQVDITNINSVNESVEKTINHFGNLTTIVNNSGMTKFGAIEEVSNEEYKELLDCMYFGPLNVIKATLPHFRKNNYGYIFNIGSVGGIKPVPYLGSYGSIKFALCGLSEALHYEVKQFNIRVAHVVLGLIKSNILSNLSNQSKLMPCYDTLKEINSSVLVRYEEKSATKVADVIIRYGNQDEIPCNIFIGQKELMEEIVLSKVREIQYQFNSQIENDLNTNL